MSASQFLYCLKVAQDVHMLPDIHVVVHAMSYGRADEAASRSHLLERHEEQSAAMTEATEE